MLRNFLNDFTANSMKKSELNGYVYEFSVDYYITDTSNITIFWIIRKIFYCVISEHN